MKSFLHTDLSRGLLAFALACLTAARLAADGIPEPSLIMYGAITIPNSNFRLSAGTLNWTFQSATRTITFSAPITNINDQFSYLLRVPCETQIGTFQASSNALKLISTPTLYNRSFVSVALDQQSAYPAVFVLSSQTNVLLTSIDRGLIERVDLQVAVPAADLDGNGLPDYWERQYFGFSGVDPNDDPDLDGMINLAEYLAGTNPLDPNSRFKILNVSAGSSGVTIQWSSADGVYYSIQRSGDLLTGFTNIGAHLPGTAPLNSWQDTNALGFGPYFYRIKIDQ